MLSLPHFAEGAFLVPESRCYWHPAHFGLRADEFRVPVRGGASVTGFLMHAAAEEPRGTVLYCHSGRKNLSFSLPQAAFLCGEGFDVLAFDPRGFGHSEGEPSLAGLGEDALAALDWLDSTTGKTEKVVLFGQFAGCDAALQLAAARPERVAGAALESCYATRAGWARAHWGPVIGRFLARSINVGAPEPADVLAALRVPCALIFPGCDAVVRSAQERAVRAAAPAGAEVWDVKGTPFLGVFAGRRGPWHEALARFLARACRGEMERPGKRRRQG